MPDDGLATRRDLLAGAGGAAAGGVIVLGLPDGLEAATRRGRQIGSGPTDRRSVGLLMTIQQVGTSLVGVGYLTRVRGLDPSALYTRPPATNATDPRASDASAARFTFYSEASIESLAQVRDVITSTGSGRVRIFFQPEGGASFDDPSSFRRGTQIALLRGTFQNDLALTAPNVANVNVTADLTQRSARIFRAGGRRLRLGARGLPWSLRAHGRGQRTEPTAPRSELSLAGDLGVIDALRQG